LFISAIQVYPAESGGQLRSLSLCQAFSDLGYDVTIYSLTGRKRDYLDGLPSSQQSINNNLIEYTNRSWIFALLQFVCYRLYLPPLWIPVANKLYCPGTLKALFLSTDFVIIDFPYLYPLKKYYNGPFYVNTHNAEFELVDSTGLIRKLVKAIEHKAFDTSDKVLFCNDKDRLAFIDKLPAESTKPYILPNGVNPSQFNSNPTLRLETRQALGLEEKHKVFLFTGSQYAPNKEAFAFLEGFANFNKDQLISLQMVIVVAGTVSLEKRNEPHFKVLGRVDSMIEYFLAADFGLNPILQGSGTNVKMIEFLATRLPILSTEFGSRGLLFEDKKSIFYFDRTSLMEIMESAVLLDQYQISELTTQAWNSNLKSIDMKEALRSLEIDWC